MTTIIGGGIAGIALAAALAHAQHKVTLYERQDTAGGGGGAFLFLDQRGHDALIGLGVDIAELHAASHAVTGLDYTNSAGVHSSRQDGGHRFWLRHNLIQVLTRALDSSGAEVHHGFGVTGITVEPGSCVLHRDGEQPVTIADELVIGADGIDSVVRSCLEPARRPTYSGDVVLYGMTNTRLRLDTVPDVLHFYAEITPDGPGSTFGHVWSPTEGTTALWFLRIPRAPLDRDDLGLRPVEEWAATVLDAAPHNRGILETLLAHTDSMHVSNARDVLLDGASEPGGQLLLVGDADHAITPAAGIGARDAVEDVHAVYEAIRAGQDPAVAMAARRAKILTDRENARRVNPRSRP
ncbi:FAD-dependent oxidoreductase [Nocardia sp. NPDC059240]|uniref:FAD-dependent oxidoreductase n=1 Tax=Nocardia sp. NPDC059240 TaxID=3346786 RepID=UPI0036A88D19